MIREVMLDGSLDDLPDLDRPVAVVFGGVTRIGDQRARRQIARALSDGSDVVWFDGWQDVERAGLGVRRRPFTDDDVDEGTIVIVGYQGLERSLPVNRLPNANRWLKKRAAASGSVPRGAIDVGDRFFRRRVRPLLVTVSSALRGRHAWKRLEPTVRSLARSIPDPCCIVYVDDYSLPVAWNAARVWTGCPAGGEYTRRPNSSVGAA